MSLKGIVQRIAWVDLNKRKVKIEKPDDDVYINYLGGYGLGAYYLFTRQQEKSDPLGPGNILGLVTGPLTGTPAITGNRFAAVGKSPKTGGWGDANCGGRFGPALKQAGLDAIFISGISDKPVYVLAEDNRVSIHDASYYWGLNCPESEKEFRIKHGKHSHSAVIGPAGERVSALAAIINDGGRAAGRSGLGMVIGSKKVKGVVAVASREVPVAEEKRMHALRSRLIREYCRPENPSYEFFSTSGTSGALESSFLEGDTPVKNWRGWKKDFAGYRKIGGDRLLELKSKPYGCWMCPIACGGFVKVPSGPYAGEGHKPEYETLGAFGAMCLNDNVDSICRLNSICNDAGMDTISVGSTIAFAIECYEKGIITKDDTGGLELVWGNHPAIVEVAEQMAKGEGFGGKVLGHGTRKAAEMLGKGAKDLAMECGGEELPMHDPRCYPGLATSYCADATPGRHTQYGAWSVEADFIPPELEHPAIFSRYNYSGKGQAHKLMSVFGHIVNSTGLCMFGSSIIPATAISEYLTLATGRKFTFDELLVTGERIANLRIAFNLREGVRNREMFRLPGRVFGKPPLIAGPTKGVTVDIGTQLKDYYLAMGWNPDTGVPRRAVFERLGLDFALEVTETL
jgi:aldehyde:ferredoxin oxidoreductase